MTNGSKVECMASGRFLRTKRKRKFRECVDPCVRWIDGIVDVEERWEASAHTHIHRVQTSS